jgi:hypothetical protein
MINGPGSEPDSPGPRICAGQDVSKSDGVGALHTGPGAEPDQGPSSHIGLGTSGWAGAGCDGPALLGRAGSAVRQEATSREKGLSPDGPADSCLMGQDSHGFITINRLEEVESGDPVLAGSSLKS